LRRLFKNASVQATPQCVGFAIAASVDLVSSWGQGSKTIFAKKRAISGITGRIDADREIIDPDAVHRKL
jgi:hypothetical protein